MRTERDQFLGVGHFERRPDRRGYADGAKPKRVDTPAGTLRLDVPKTAGSVLDVHTFADVVHIFEVGH